MGGAKMVQEYKDTISILQKLKRENQTMFLGGMEVEGKEKLVKFKILKIEKLAYHISFFFAITIISNNEII